MKDKKIENLRTEIDNLDQKIQLLIASRAELVKEVAKVKKDANDWQISLTKTTDILQQLTKEKTKNQFVVGFALETEDELVNAKEKLVKKNLDMIVLNSLNDKGAGFTTDSNKITIIEKDNNMEEFELKHKQQVASDILNQIIKIL